MPAFGRKMERRLSGIGPGIEVPSKLWFLEQVIDYRGVTVIGSEMQNGVSSGGNLRYIGQLREVDEGLYLPLARRRMQRHPLPHIGMPGVQIIILDQQGGHSDLAITGTQMQHRAA